MTLRHRLLRCLICTACSLPSDGRITMEGLLHPPTPPQSCLLCRAHLHCPLPVWVPPAVMCPGPGLLAAQQRGQRTRRAVTLHHRRSRSKLQQSPWRMEHHLQTFSTDCTEVEAETSTCQAAVCLLPWTHWLTLPRCWREELFQPQSHLSRAWVVIRWCLAKVVG